MKVEAYASRNNNQVHKDVLSQARESCYKARDAFYACLGKHSSNEHTERGYVGLLYPSQCKGSRAVFENNCRPSWVKHFDAQFCKNKRTQRLLDDKETRRAMESYWLTLSVDPMPFTSIIESHT